MLMMSAAVWAAHAVNPDSAVAAQTVSGAYAVTFSVKAPSTIQSGSSVTCKARIAPRLTGQGNGPETVPAQTAQGVATLSGLAANCTVVVPFSFASGDPRGGAALSYEIDAVNGTTLEAVRKQEGIAVAYPQPGATANVHLDVNF
jgi:hypothetical protein